MKQAQSSRQRPLPRTRPSEPRPAAPGRRKPAATAGSDERLTLLIARMALGAYTLLLIAFAWASVGSDHDGFGLWRLRALRDTLEILVAFLQARILDMLPFLPLGLLAAFCFAWRHARVARVLRVALPAFVLAVLLAALVRSFQIERPFRWPGMLTLFMPALGCLVGTWLGMTWRRGPRARWLFFPRALAAGAIVALVLGLLAYLAFEPAPFEFQPERVTAADKAQLYALFKDKNPRWIPEGETRSLSLSQADLDRLLSWGLVFNKENRKGRVTLADERATLRVTLGIPTERFERRFLNLTLGGRGFIDDGVPSITAEHLSLGRLEVSDLWLSFLSRMAERVARGDQRLRGMLAPIVRARLNEQSLEIEYSHANLPAGFVRSLFQEDGGMEELLPMVRAQADHLITSAPFLPAGEGRFGGAIEAAFALARQRSQIGDAVMENRAALLALGIFMGHDRIESFVGDVMSEPARETAEASYSGATLRGSDALARLFITQAALVVLDSEGLGDAASLIESELDAESQGAFFPERLLAREAGRMFGRVATRDPEAAEAMQRRLALGFHVSDFLPESGELPAPMDAAELEATYGGKDDPRYLSLVSEIERRIAACPGYQASGAGQP